MSDQEPDGEDPQIYEIPIGEYVNDDKRAEIERINRELQLNGLTENNAAQVIYLSGRTPIDRGLNRKARTLAALELGLMSPGDAEPDIYDYAAQIRLDDDIRSTELLTQYSVDPKIAIREYEDLPWEQIAQARLKPGEPMPPKPRFADMIKAILYAAIYRKGWDELATEANKHSTVSADGGMNRVHYDYKQAVEEIDHHVHQKPRELTKIDKSIWHDLITTSLRDLHTTQALAHNSTFREDILDVLRPEVKTATYEWGATFRKRPVVDVPSLIRPSTPKK